MTSYAHEKDNPYQYRDPKQVIIYGTQPTKKSIEEVTLFMMKNYSFNNFEEWASLLKIYNIKPILLPANEKRAKPGILYSLIDGKSNKTVGVPILAGELKGKPTFNTLSSLYKRQSLDQKDLSSRVTLELTFLKGIYSKSELINQLRTRGIDTIFNQDPKDQSETVSYIDHFEKCVVDERKLPEEFKTKNLITPKDDSFAIKRKKLNRGLRP